MEYVTVLALEFSVSDSVPNPVSDWLRGLSHDSSWPCNKLLDPDTTPDDMFDNMPGDKGSTRRPIWVVKLDTADESLSLNSDIRSRTDLLSSSSAKTSSLLSRPRAMLNVRLAMEDFGPMPVRNGTASHSESPVEVCAADCVDIEPGGFDEDLRGLGEGWSRSGRSRGLASKSDDGRELSLSGEKETETFGLAAACFCWRKSSAWASISSAIASSAGVGWGRYDPDDWVEMEEITEVESTRLWGDLVGRDVELTVAVGSCFPFGRIPDFPIRMLLAWSSVISDCEVFRPICSDFLPLFTSRAPELWTTGGGMRLSSVGARERESLDWLKLPDRREWVWLLAGAELSELPSVEESTSLTSGTLRDKSDSRRRFEVVEETEVWGVEDGGELSSSSGYSSGRRLGVEAYIPRLRVRPSLRTVLFRVLLMTTGAEALGAVVLVPGVVSCRESHSKVS